MTRSGLQWQSTSIERAARNWERRRPACNERFSAKRSSIDSIQGNAINSMRPLPRGPFAPIGAHCGRDARAPRALRVFKVPRLTTAARPRGRGHIALAISNAGPMNPTSST
jgi:hypothetical protein